MSGQVRRATPADLPVLLSLAAEKRYRYAAYQPRFWRPAPGAAEAQSAFFSRLLGREDVIALVHEQGGKVDGFLLADLVPAPPVYDPGGPTLRIDDFWVAGGADWSRAGRVQHRLGVVGARDLIHASIIIFTLCGFHLV